MKIRWKARSLSNFAESIYHIAHNRYFTQDM